MKKEYEKSAAGSWNETVAFGDIIHFSLNGDKITANLLGAVSPAPLIVATAVVEYGNDLKVKTVNWVEEKE